MYTCFAGSVDFWLKPTVHFLLFSDSASQFVPCCSWSALFSLCYSDAVVFCKLCAGLAETVAGCHCFVTMQTWAAAILNQHPTVPEEQVFCVCLDRLIRKGKFLRSFLPREKSSLAMPVTIEVKSACFTLLIMTCKSLIESRKCIEWELSSWSSMVSKTCIFVGQLTC